MSGMRDKLLGVVRKLDTDFEPFGKAEPEELDCGSNPFGSIKLFRMNNSGASSGKPVNSSKVAAVSG